MFDIIFGVVLVLMLVFGFLKGFMKELLVTIGMVCGFIAADKLHLGYMHYLAKYVRSPAEAKVLTYLAILVAGYLAAIVIDSIIFMIVKRGRPGTLGRVFGGVLGAIKGLVLCLAIFFIVRGFIPAFSDELDTSFLAPYLQTVWKYLHSIGMS